MIESLLPWFLGSSVIYIEDKENVILSLEMESTILNHLEWFWFVDFKFYQIFPLRSKEPGSKIFLEYPAFRPYNDQN